MKKRIYALLLLAYLMVSAAYADILCDDSTQTISKIIGGNGDGTENYFCVPRTDLSYGYLSTIFGTVGTVLIGHSNQLIGQIFSIFNSGLMIFISIFVGYSVLMTLIKSTQEGGFSASGVKGGLDGIVILRVCFGLSIITPMYTGYSLIQIWVMWAVLHGVGFADTIWATTLDYLSKHSLQSVYRPIGYDASYAWTPSSATTTKGNAIPFINQGMVLGSKLSDSSDTHFNFIQTNQASSASIYDLAFCVSRLNYQANMKSGGFFTPQEMGFKNPMTYLSTKQYYIFGCAGTSSDKRKCGCIGTLTQPASQSKFNAKQTLVQDAFYQALASTDKFLAFVHEVTATHMVDEQYRNMFHACANNGNFQVKSCISNILGTPDFTRPYASTARSVASIMADQLALLAMETPADASSSYNKVKIQGRSQANYGWLSAGSYFRALSGATPLQNPNNWQAQTAGLINPFFTVKQPTKVDNSSYANEFQINVQAQAIQDTINDMNQFISTATNESLSGDLNDVSTTKDLATSNLFNWVNTGIKADGLGGDIRSTSLMGSYSLDTIKDNMTSMMQNFLGAFIGLNLKTCTEQWFKSKDIKTHAYSWAMSTPKCAYTGSWNIGLYGALYNRDKGTLLPPLVNFARVGQVGMDQAGQFFTNTFNNTINGIKGLWKTVYLPVMLSITIASAVIGGICASAGLSGMAVGGVIQDMGNSINSIIGFMFQLDQQILMMYTPMGTAIASIIFFISMIMTVYFPLIPVLLFIFSGIGWMISVVEAMVAGPIIAVGMAHPEGHDLLGRAEMSMMLLFSVFVKPAVIIISYIIAIIVLYIAMDLVDDSFMHVLSDVAMYGSSSAQGDPNNLRVTYMVLGGIFIVYFYVIWKVIEQVFSLVYVVPDKIMRWIGGPSDPSQVGTLMGEVAKGAGDKASEAASGASQAAAAIKSQGAPQMNAQSSQTASEYKSAAKAQQST